MTPKILTIKAKADGLGVSGYIAKPFKKTILRDRIKGIIALTAQS